MNCDLALLSTANVIVLVKISSWLIHLLGKNSHFLLWSFASRPWPHICYSLTIDHIRQWRLFPNFLLVNEAHKLRNPKGDYETFYLP